MTDFNKISLSCFILDLFSLPIIIADYYFILVFFQEKAEINNIFILK